MTDPEYGPFATAFERDSPESPNYLALLNLAREDVPIVIDRIEHALAAGDSQRWIDALLTQPNWRPHLVAAIAFLLDRASALDCTPLWTAIDAGSWVTPQLIVTALFSDPTFPEQVRRRVELRCPVAVPQDLTPLERHVATGPTGPRGRSVKMLASILGVCSSVPSLAASEAEWRADPAIRTLNETVSHDWSEGEDIARHWMSAARAQFLKRGVVLSPAAFEPNQGRA